MYDAIHQVFFFPADEGEEDHQQTCIDDQGPDLAVDLYVSLGKEQSDGNGEIEECRLQVIRYWGFLLSDKIREYHTGAIACETAPGTGHVAVFGHKDEIDGEQYSTTDSGEDGTPPGLVDEFIPEREVEIDAHEYFGHHDDGHHAQALPVAGGNKILEDVEIGHHRQEGQQGEDDKVLHDQRLGFLAAAFFAAAEDEGFVGIAEGLGNQGHNHGYLHTGTIDAQLHLALLAGDEVVEAYLVRHLVEDAGDAEEQQGPCVAEHLFQQLPVYAAAQLAEFGQEAQGDAGGTDEVHDKDIAHLVVGVIPAHQLRVGMVKAWGDKEHEEVQADVAKDIQKFEEGELERPALEAQQGEEDGLEGIDGHHTAHHGEEFGMGVVAEAMGYGLDEAEEQEQEQGRDAAHGRQSRGEDGVGAVAVLVGKIEEGGLHAKGEDDQHEGGVGINLGDNAIAAGGGSNLIGVERDEQVVQETAYNTAHAVNHRIRK